MSKTRTKAIRQEFEAVNGFLIINRKQANYKHAWRKFKKEWKVKR